MYTAIKNSWALLLGLGFLMLGNGLQGSLVGIRASLEGFPTAVTGLVMSGYYAGFLVGSLITPKILANVGHVRVFAALASLASSAALLYAVFVDPFVWGVMRLLTGFSFAGLYIVCESWLNDAATNETRGQLLSVYMIIMMGGMAVGQLFLNMADPAGYTLFIFISVLVSIALIPMALTASSAPNFQSSTRLKLKELYNISPLGVIGMFAQGITGGAFYGMAAVYGGNIGLSVAQISIFISVMILGGVLLQWPIGRLSDRFDRRMVLMITTMLSGFAALLALYGGETQNFVLFLAAAALFGGFSVPLYSLCIAHTNDHLDSSKMVAASSGLIMMNGVGAIFGPIIVGPMMGILGSAFFFGWIAFGHIAIGLFAIYRMSRAPSSPADTQSAFVAMPVRNASMVAVLHPEIEEWAEEAEEEAQNQGETEDEIPEILDDGPALGDSNP
ncbi:MAG: MFS transporter [Sneathiella sp.]|jgi:MFS family permease|uniref:MFS transporter n=1 Tax=Sneathiella sp. TaxID=1964365 RepID=UPI000C50E432|nr:MFS transporter [Sneathiella sp.]MAL79561.1 MFS transporter [Sneathiella sp.]